MVLYNYKAQSMEGRIANGQCWCHSEYDLIKFVKEKELFLISFRVNKNNKGLFKRKVPLKQIAVLCEYFYSLLCCGINVVEVINIVEAQVDNKGIKKSLKDMENMVKQGMQISTCMRMYHNIYPKLLVDMVTIGEESGKLDSIFKKLSVLYYKESTIKNKLIKSLIYPCTLFIVSLITVQCMIAFIVPIFMNMLISLNAEIPKATRLIFTVGNFINKNIFKYLALLVVVIMGMKLFNKTENIKKSFYGFVFKNILTRKLITQINGIKFSRYFGLLINSGIHVIGSLEITSSIIGNSFIKERLEKSIDKIKAGSSLNEGINSMNMFPRLLCSMIKVGEETGRLDEMLMKSSEILEEEFYNLLDKLIVLIEPVMIIVLSGIIGVIIISFVLPMFSIMDAI